MELKRIEATCPNCKLSNSFPYQFKSAVKTGYYTFTHDAELQTCPVKAGCGKEFVLQVDVEIKYDEGKAKTSFISRTFQLVEAEKPA